MSTLQFNTANTEGVNFNATYTAYDQTAAISSTNSPDNPGPPFTVGTTVKGTGDSDFVFVKASAAIGAGDTCTITSAFLAAGVTTTNAALGNLIGIAVVDIANGSYGWLQRAGQSTGGIKVLSACAPNAALSTTATAGTLDDAVTTSLKVINGIIINATQAATGLAAGTLNYPVVGATL